METKRMHTPMVALPVGIVSLLVFASATPSQAAGAASPTTVVQSVGAATPAKASGSWEKKILKQTNKQRRKHGCKKLKAHKKLRKAARKHSRKMAAADNLSHQLPGEPTMSTRIERAGYRNWGGLAENIAYGYATPKSTVKAWMKSPGHRENIVNCRYRHLGVGVVIKGGVSWSTQDFGHK